MMNNYSAMLCDAIESSIVRQDVDALRDVLTRLASYLAAIDACHCVRCQEAQSAAIAGVAEMLLRLARESD